MLGTSIQLTDKTVRVVRIISEGGYGFVYLVEDDQRCRYALKKVITQDNERLSIVTKELRFMQEHARKPNPYFIGYIDGRIVQTKKDEHVVYMLLEFGESGTLFDLMAKRLEIGTNFTEAEIVGLVASAARGLQHMHELGYVYCDMKIENCLYSDMQTVKLCDFGSVNQLDLDFAKLPRSAHYQYEELFEKQTTLMYRPPEMCDPYLQYRVNTQADMWALGCVLYTLMFFKHPFAEASKLAITSASFHWPAEPVYSSKPETLVRNLLTPKPDLRPTAKEVAVMLGDWGNATPSLNVMAAEIKRERESKTNAIRHIGDGMPVKKVKNANELGFDVFDFSGLNKISKKSHTPMAMPKSKELTKAHSTMATPSMRKGANLINDDVFSKVGQKKSDFDFFAQESQNPDMALKFEQPAEYNFDAFAEPDKTAGLKHDFDDFLSFDVAEKKPEEPKKETKRSDLDDLDFENY